MYQLIDQQNNESFNINPTFIFSAIFLQCALLSQVCGRCTDEQLKQIHDCRGEHIAKFPLCLKSNFSEENFFSVEIVT